MTQNQQLHAKTERYRNSSSYMSGLSEEQQLAHIYGSSKSRQGQSDKQPIHTSSYSRKGPSMPQIDELEKIDHQSSTLSFMSGGILDTNWRQMKLYICYRTFVWIFPGIIIFWLSSHHQYTLTENDPHSFENTPQKYCCECYQYAMSQSLLPPNQRRRIDWSYCGLCIDCRKCMKNDYITNITSSFIGEDATCKGASGFMDDEIKRCADEAEYVSMTTMKIFNKNYRNYGWGALIITMIYVVFMISAICCGEKSIHTLDTIGMLLMVYNIVVSMVCLYMVYKPFQYQREYITDDVENGPYCYEDTVSDQLEDALTAFVWGLNGLLAWQWLFCCCKLSFVDIIV